MLMMTWASILPAGAQEAPSHLIECDPAPVPIAEGGFGVEWTTDARSGAILPSIEVTSAPGDRDQWLLVQVFGSGDDHEFRLGPYSAGGSTFSVPIDLDGRATSAGLVQVIVRLEVVDEATGELRASRRSRPAYVVNAATASETWFDEATATALAVQRLGALVAEGSELDGVTGVEVTPCPPSWRCWGCSRSRRPRSPRP